MAETNYLFTPTGGADPGRIKFSQESPDHNFVVGYVKSQVDALRTEMKGEIATVMAAVKEAEVQRSSDYKDLERAISGVRTELPTKETIRNYALLMAGLIVGFIALMWAIFGAGISTSGVWADQILEAKGAAETQQEQGNAILQSIEELKAERQQTLPASESRR